MFIGSKNIPAIKLGDKDISSIFKGDQLLFSARVMTSGVFRLVKGMPSAMINNLESVDYTFKWEEDFKYNNKTTVGTQYNVNGAWVCRYKWRDGASANNMLDFFFYHESLETWRLISIIEGSNINVELYNSYSPKDTDQIEFTKAFDGDIEDITLRWSKK